MKYLHEVLLKSKNEFPAHIAVQDIGGRQLNYDSLYSQATLIQEKLEVFGIKSGKRVGVIASKEIETVCILFGVLQTNATYIPLDVEAPINRNLSIVENCQPQALFIEEKLVETYEGLRQKYQKVEWPSLPNMCLYIRKESAGNHTSHEEDLALILYTSGSTGKPKGVKITHQNALSFIFWADETFNLSDNDVFSSIAPFHFDLSIFDLYVGIKNGAKIVLLNANTTRNPRMISTLIDQLGISVCYATPSLLKLMVTYGKLERFNHQSLRYVLFAGEVFQINSLKAIKEKWNTALFYNLYGPTETNVVSYYKIPDQIKDRRDPFPIGKSCSFAKIKVMDSSKNEEVEEGELWVTGKSVSPGYWSQVATQSNSFVHDEAGIRWYKTGDWVKSDAEGNLLFLGRKDRMVKRNGYRIELAEIEKTLSKHSKLLGAAVVVKKRIDTVEICAYYQLSQPATEPIDAMQLQVFCLKYIPKYMLPDRFINIEKIPQTSTHKIDYQMLSEI